VHCYCTVLYCTVLISAVCLLHGWSRVKLLPSQRMFCVHASSFVFTRIFSSLSLFLIHALFYSIFLSYPHEYCDLSYSLTCAIQHRLLHCSCSVAAVETCSDGVRNGQLSATCDRYPAEVCSYTCNEGYRAKPNADHIVCSTSGHWDVDTDSLCLVTCPQDLPDAHGHADESCVAVAGQKCKLKCDEGYTPASAGGVLPEIVCGKDRQWTVVQGECRGECRGESEMNCCSGLTRVDDGR